MKHLFTAFFSLLLIGVQAQTADEIVQRNITMLGGIDALTKVKTYKITGLVTTQGMDMPIITQVVNGKSVRTDISVMDQSIVMVYSNGTGWQINPFAGVTEPTDVTGNQLNDLKSQSSLVNALIDYKNRGHQLELIGQEDVDGVKSFKLKLDLKDEDRTVIYYINVTDFTLVKSITKREIQGQRVDVETYFSDYKDAGGIKFAYSRIQKVEGQVLQEMHIDKIELNLPVDEAIFKK